MPRMNRPAVSDSSLMNTSGATTQEKNAIDPNRAHGYQADDIEKACQRAAGKPVSQRPRLRIAMKWNRSARPCHRVTPIRFIEGGRIGV